MTKRLALLCVVALLLPSSFALVRAADKTDAPAVAFPFKDGDRVAWVGSSSTNIGVWPKTMEFLLRTRHPELKLTFKRYSTGGGTFATGLQNLDKWLADGKPTVVFFNTVRLERRRADMVGFTRAALSIRANYP